MKVRAGALLLFIALIGAIGLPAVEAAAAPQTITMNLVLSENTQGAPHEFSVHFGGTSLGPDLPGAEVTGAYDRFGAAAPSRYLEITVGPAPLGLPTDPLTNLALYRGVTSPSGGLDWLVDVRATQFAHRRFRGSIHIVKVLWTKHHKYEGCCYDTRRESLARLVMTSV